MTNSGLNGEMGGLIKVETITPEMARSLLARDSKNRPLRQRIVDRYASDMEAGKWQLNGETLKIAVNGDVLDGQHRLSACVQAKASFETVMVYDLPHEAFRTIDNGKPRSLADLIGLRDIPYSTNIASAVPYVMFWDRAPGKMQMAINRPNAFKLPTRNEKFEWLEKSNIGLWIEAARMAWRCQSLAPVSVSCAAFYIAGRTSESNASVFFDKVATVIGVLTDDDPAGALRNRLIRDKGRRLQASAWEKFGWFMKAWGAHNKGEKIKQLRIQTKGRVERIGGLREATI